MERILGGPTYRELQMAYKHSPVLDPLDTEIQFTYSAKILWIYECSHIKNKRPVIAIATNTLCPLIIAVGHGKFYYNETDKGYICVWCVKNLKHPERYYK